MYPNGGVGQNRGTNGPTKILVICTIRISKGMIVLTCFDTYPNLSSKGHFVDLPLLGSRVNSMPMEVSIFGGFATFELPSQAN